MARFKKPDTGLKLIPVDFDLQVLPGTFEHALNYLIDHELDLSGFDARYRNDATGVPAFAPAVLLKIVLLAYSRGLVSSRAMAGACRQNVLFMAVSGDSSPHFTPLTAFVSELGDEAAKLFTQVLLICQRQGLIGGTLFAIDGVKLPANAAKAKSGTRADFEREAGKMATGKGVIQGYTGVAAVDRQVQVVVEAQAHGTGSEQELLLPVVKASTALRRPETVICADAGYHSEDNLKDLGALGIDAYLCDNGYRQRDPRYANQERHKAKPDPLWDKTKAEKPQARFRPADFQPAEDKTHCLCPAGKRLYRNGQDCTINGYAVMKYRGAERDCAPCNLRERCLRTPSKTKTRQVAIFQGKRPGRESHTDRMKPKIDSARGKAMIAARFAAVEPVFGNVRHNKGLSRFTLRGQRKVDGQWKLYCLVHNLEKLAHHGYAR